MHWKLFRPLFFLAMAPSVALAQTQLPAQDGRADSPAASVSAYQSAFTDYKPYTEPVVMSWRKVNDQVRDTGGMQGHDMATMKSQSEDPHAGHDMSKIGANPAAPVGPGVGAFTDEAGASHGAEKAQAEDPHAGHGMSKMTPAKPAALTPVKPHLPSTAKKPGASHRAMKAQPADPHAGHDMSKMSALPRQDVPDGRDKANHGAHSAPPTDQPNNKREKE